jgi:pseudouridine-5'-phosphate glycosidase
MTTISMIEVRPHVGLALTGHGPVVALESTLIAQGLPWPINFETARAAEAAVRKAGAVPATIAILGGKPTIGLSEKEIETLARAASVMKASARDIAIAVTQGRDASTTVAATMLLAYHSGIRVLATGGIGGAHREPAPLWDISADLFEIARLPAAVVCAGAKSILDIPRTLEILESHGVPVLGYRTDDFPGFFLPSTGHPVTARIDEPAQAAATLQAHWQLKGSGVVIAQPVPQDAALDPNELSQALSRAESEVIGKGVRGNELTPYLLARLAEFTEGKSLHSNQALIVANADLAARIAVCLAEK